MAESYHLPAARSSPAKSSMKPLKYPLAHLSPAKDDLVVIEIARESVVTGEIQYTLEKLNWLSASREACFKWEGTLTFYFDGWLHDPRETAEIPEIRAFFRQVTEAWPYWFHFCEKVDDTLMHVLRLLCQGQYVRRQAGVVTWSFDDLSELTTQMMRLFSGQNRLYDHFGLPERMNERISQEIAQLVGNSWSPAD